MSTLLIARLCPFAVPTAVGSIPSLRTSVLALTRDRIGVFIGAAYTGWFGDWFIINYARKRGRGIYEPEYRLWLFSASAILIPFSLILWGVGASHHVQWFGCVFAMGKSEHLNRRTTILLFPTPHGFILTRMQEPLQSPTPLVYRSVSATASIPIVSWLESPS